jgi:PilZ domain
MDCIVRDISETGARLQFPSPQKITELLDLHIPIKGQSFHSRVCWEDGNEVGVAFHATAGADMGDIGPDERMDRLEAEIVMLKQAIRHLQKNADQKLQAL